MSALPRPRIFRRGAAADAAGWPATLVALTVLLVGSFAVAVMLGESVVGLSRVIDVLLGQSASRLDRIAVWEVRLPRAIVAAAAGACLGVAGALLQALFRNPLASPDLTGVSSGAVAAAVVWLSVVGAGAGDVNLVVPVVATLGGFAATLLVYALARRFGRTEGTTLVLTGIVVAGVLNGLTTVALLFAGPDDDQFLGWVVGSLALRSWPEVRVVAVAVLVVAPLVVLAMPAANLLQLGDDVATGLGFPAERARILVLAAAVAATATAVAVAGAIGFLGLVAPHLGRGLAGADARRLVPASALLGASILLLADLLARTFRLSWFPFFAGMDAGRATVPVGVFTILLGVPFFLRLLLRRR